jgi:hypothetical protein
MPDEPKTENNQPDKDKIFDLYKLIVETRNFEIEYFWKRALFFWGTLTIILVGYFKIGKEQEYYLSFISFGGFIYTLIFSLSIRGSKFWQENWEQKVVLFQNELKKIYPELKSYFDIFGIPLHSIIKEKEHGSFSLFRSYRFSVSKLVLILSDITLLFTFLLLIRDSITLFSNGNWDCKSSTIWEIIAFILTVAFSSLYITIFLCGESKRNNDILKTQEMQKNSKKE